MTEALKKPAYQLRLPAPKPLLQLTWDKPCKLVFAHARRLLIRTPKTGQLRSVN